MSNKLGASFGGNSNGNRRKYFVDPAADKYQAVIVDVIDLGYQKSPYNGQIQQKIKFALQLDAAITEKAIKKAKKAAGLGTDLTEDDLEVVGKRYMVWSKPFPVSMYPGGTNRNGDPLNASGLYKFISDLLGDSPENFPEYIETVTDELGNEEEQFIFENLVGANAIVMVSKKKHGDRVYTNIASIMPIDEDDELELIEPDDTYVRVRDRENFSAPPTREQVEESENGEGVKAEVSTKAKAAASDDIPWDDD